MTIALHRSFIDPDFRPTLTATLGLPGSGKSTWAMQYRRKARHPTVCICKDEMRDWLVQMEGGVKAKESRVIALQSILIESYLRESYNVVVHDTNLNPIHIERLKAICRKTGATYRSKSFLDVPIETCIVNDAKRRGKTQVGEKVIRDMAEQWLTEESTDAKEA